MLEDIIAKIKTILQTNLPAKLTAISTARADGIILPNITTYFTIDKLKDTFLNYPVVFILGQETPSGDRPGRRREFVHGISISVFIRGTDEDTLQKQLWRYIEGVEKTLNQDNTLGGTSTWARIISHKLEPSSKEGMFYVKNATMIMAADERLAVV